MSEPLITALVALLLAVAGLVAAVAAWVRSQIAVRALTSHLSTCRREWFPDEVEAFDTGYAAGYAQGRRDEVAGRTAGPRAHQRPPSTGRPPT